MNAVLHGTGHHARGAEGVASGMLPALGLLLGLAFVVLGAEALVRGAARTAAALGVPPLLVGLTVVAYGTSAPELSVSVQAGVAGRPDLALANVLGSNVFNVLAIVGLSALATPLVARAEVVRREVPILLAATVVTLSLAADGALGRGDGLLLLAGLALVTLGQLRTARAGLRAARSTPRPAPSFVRDAALMAVGLVALILGARWLVDAAVALALAWGVSELIVGLTIVAAGTSVPELATSLVAALRGERDLAIGNVVGSNVFNLLGILGVAAVAAPAGLSVAPQVTALDAWVVLAAALLLLPMAWTGAVVARWEGAVLLVGYLGYLAWIVAIATDRLPLPAPWLGATVAAVPVVVVAGVAVASWARRRPPGGSRLG